MGTAFGIGPDAVSRACLLAWTAPILSEITNISINEPNQTDFENSILYNNGIMIYPQSVGSYIDNNSFNLIWIILCL